ncbi:8870_t:CDS:1, partial [Gigaspora rosea]
HNELDRSSFNINSGLLPEQLNQVVALFNEVPQVYAKKISKSGQTVELGQTNL